MSYSLLSHLRLLEVITDFLHQRRIVSPLHSEFFVFKDGSATARVTFTFHCTVCKADGILLIRYTNVSALICL